MNAAQFYTSGGHKSESMIKHLIIANKISDATYNWKCVKIFSICADCKSTDCLNRNKPKYLGLYTPKIQSLCFSYITQNVDVF